MFCNNCGKEINEKAVVCPYCGVITNQNALKAESSEKQTNTMAIIGFIFSFFIAIVGLVCSIIGYKKAPELGGNGKGMALAGIIISSISLVLTAVLIIILVVAMASISVMI